MASPEIISGLGSRDSLIHAAPGADQRGLSKEEAQLASCAGMGTSLGDVLSHCGLPEPRAIALLLSMRLRGLIGPGALGGAKNVAAARPGGVAARPTPAPVRPAAARPTAAIDASALSEAGVEIDDARKREILEAEVRCQDADLFRVLGVEDGAEAAEVKRAYYELTKKFHPDRFYGKQLGSFKGRIDKIFKRFTEAQGILSDANKRQAWLGEHSEFAGQSQSVAPAATEHSDERRARLARHPYMAKFSKVHELVSRGKDALQKNEFGRAYADLHLASQIDPKNAEVQKLLAAAKRGGDRGRAEKEFSEAQSCETTGDVARAITLYRSAASLDPENARYAFHAAKVLLNRGGDGELKEAHTLARRASELDPNNADYHLTFARVLVRAGLEKNAAREYEQVLKLRPGDPTAKEQLRKLKWKL